MGLEVFSLLNAFALCKASLAEGYHTQNNYTFVSDASSGKALERASFATGAIPSNL